MKASAGAQEKVSHPRALWQKRAVRLRGAGEKEGEREAGRARGADGKTESEKESRDASALVQPLLLLFERLSLSFSPCPRVGYAGQKKEGEGGRKSTFVR